MSLYYPSRLWKNWQEALIIVQPETVKWHREGFRLYWRWKSRAPVGRPKTDLENRELIRKMSRENRAPENRVPETEPPTKVKSSPSHEWAAYIITTGGPHKLVEPLLPG